ncbi:MAG: hypothetical protein LUC34_01630, partial [Campylobacter sp.]|nr:hypothetical protein [Campylobacter sp.]
MQKVIVRKLGPIEECEIVLKPFTVFVGESGTGKSVMLRAISLLRWIYKKMQYKELLKQSKTRSDALRFRLESLLRISMLEDFFTKETYIEFFVDEISLITIANGKLNVKYNQIKNNTFLVGKILFLNDIRSSLPEILSSPSGKRAKWSYYTNDLIENFYESIRYSRNFSLETMNITLTSKKRVGYDQFYILNNNNEIKFENASSGEKNISILELVCKYFAESYDFADGFSKAVVDLITQR